MIRHVVLFKFKPEVDTSARVQFVQMLGQLQHDVEMVRRLEVGQNFTQTSRASDVCLIVDVDDEAALSAYGDHPKHQPVKQMLAQVCAEVRVADYVVEA